MIKPAFTAHYKPMFIIYVSALAVVVVVLVVVVVVALH